MDAVERQALQDRLKDAEAQYHEIALGRSVRVFVDQNGERVEYTAANLGRLQTYIATLKHQLGRGSSFPGPMRPWF